MNTIEKTIGMFAISYAISTSLIGLILIKTPGGLLYALPFIGTSITLILMRKKMITFFKNKQIEIYA